MLFSLFCNSFRMFRYDLLRFLLCFWNSLQQLNTPISKQNDQITENSLNFNKNLKEQKRNLWVTLVRSFNLCLTFWNECPFTSSTFSSSLLDIFIAFSWSKGAWGREREDIEGILQREIDWNSRDFRICSRTSINGSWWCKMLIWNSEESLFIHQSVTFLGFLTKKGGTLHVKMKIGNYQGLDS